MICISNEVILDNHRLYHPNQDIFSPTSYTEILKVKSLSHVQLFVTPWTVASQAPQSMEFSRQEYWSGFPFPSPGDLPDPGIKPGSPTLQADALPSEPTTSFIYIYIYIYIYINLNFIVNIFLDFLSHIYSLSILYFPLLEHFWKWK